MSKINLESLSEKVYNLTIFPAILGEIAKVTNDPDATIEDMENIILTDQALTTRVLQLANSAHYGYSQSIATISQATILLGFNTISSVAIASTVNAMMEDDVKGKALTNEQLWLQSQACAIMSRYIAKKTSAHDPEEAYIAGLVRDMGKTMLNRHLLEEYNEVVDLVLKEKVSFSQAESEILGFTHCDIGLKVAENWNLPEILLDTIENHHIPMEAEHIELVSIVHIADAMTTMMGIGLGPKDISCKLYKEALEALEMDLNDFKEIISESSQIIRDEKTFFKSEK